MTTLPTPLLSATECRECCRIVRHLLAKHDRRDIAALDLRRAAAF